MKHMSRVKLLGFFADPWVKLFAAAFVFPALNQGFYNLIALSEIPLFLDSNFTGIAACFGLPYGLLTAFMTNFLAELQYGFPWRHLPFALCGMATAIIVWRMARLDKLRTPMHFVVGTLLVAFANSLLGAIIATFVFGGGTATNIDVIVMGFALMFDNIFSAAFLGRFIVNLFDKAPVLFAALLFWRYLASPQARASAEALPAGGSRAPSA
jgi:hypothetical protein